MRLLTTLLCIFPIGAGCGQSSLGVLPGVVNDPHNLTLRRAILAFAQSQFCGEMQRRSAPLRLSGDAPAVGRFFVDACLAQQLESETLFIQFQGRGYVHTNVTKRMTFDASGAVEYDHDFLMSGSTMYAYFRQRSTSAATFRAKVVEQPLTALLGSLPFNSSSGALDQFGTQLMQNELARGFTVIRHDDSSVEFGLGVVELGAKVPSPYKRTEAGIMFANDRAEVHQNQREFVGPITLDSDARLNLAVLAEGAPGIDVFLLPQAPGTAWQSSYLSQLELTPLPGPPIVDEAVIGGTPWQRLVPVTKGTYFLVFDNSSRAGRTNPPGSALDDRFATVSYAVEIRD